MGGFSTVHGSVSFVSPALADGIVVESPTLVFDPLSARPAATDRPAVIEREVIVDGRVVVERAEVALNGTGIPAPLPPSRAPVTVDPSQTAFAVPHLHSSVNGRMQELRMQVQMGRNPMSGVTSQVGNFALLRSQRNPTPLFGLGLLDAIDDKTLVAASLKKHKKFPEVSGRVARLKDGRIGRFGWKSQIVSLEDFTLTACAVELGLDVPKHPQAGSTQNPKYKSPGLDMSKAQADAMVAFLSSLPAPTQRPLLPGKHKQYIDGGEALFTKVGCATCHTKDLGEAKGVYSDLLVHDMGPELGDSGGSYGVFIPNSSPDDDEPVEIQPLVQSFGPRPINQGPATAEARKKKKIIGATRQEWRTPPLWGLRDSSPYLHDGRADTVEQAIAMHGGEARRIVASYFKLKPGERQQVTLFLKSQVAPKQTAVATAK
jgi:hypothetical protein